MVHVQAANNNGVTINFSKISIYSIVVWKYFFCVWSDVHSCLHSKIYSLGSLPIKHATL